MWQDNAVEDALGQLEVEDFTSAMQSTIRAVTTLCDLALSLSCGSWMKVESNSPLLAELGHYGMHCRNCLKSY